MAQGKDLCFFFIPNSVVRCQETAGFLLGRKLYQWKVCRTNKVDYKEFQKNKDAAGMVFNFFSIL